MKDKWYFALRSALHSPDYLQAQGQLRETTDTDLGPGLLQMMKDSKFPHHEEPEPKHCCCLGVLTDLCIQDLPAIGKWEMNERYPKKGWDFHVTPDDPKLSDICHGMPPHLIYTHTGLGKQLGSLLAKLNDDGYSFHQIADVLDAIKVFGWANAEQFLRKHRHSRRELFEEMNFELGEPLLHPKLDPNGNSDD